jgi:hypothetical protein
VYYIHVTDRKYDSTVLYRIWFYRFFFKDAKRVGNKVTPAVPLCFWVKMMMGGYMSSFPE